MCLTKYTFYFILIFGYYFVTLTKKVTKLRAENECNNVDRWAESFL
jgi:hypothetical protein